MRKAFLFIVVYAFSTCSVFAQVGHGKITYAVRFVDSGLSDEELAMLPSEASIWFNADRMRMDMSMGMGMESAVIVHRDKVHVLMDVFGNKFAMRSSKEEIRKGSKGSDAYRVMNLTDDFKDIAGYRCRKAVLSAKGQDDMTVWFTDRLRTTATWYYMMDGLEGFPMEFDWNTTGMAVRMSAKSVSDEVPSDAVFAIGADYKLLTHDEVNKMMGSGR